MSDKFQGGIVAGSADVSIPIVLRSTTDNTEATGKVAADLTLSYWRQGGTRTAITASDLAAVNSAHSDGGVKEVDATNEPGLYRLDLPDAAVASGADWVVISVKAAGVYVFHERFAITTHVIQTGDSFARLGAPAGASVSADVANVKTQTAAIETDTQDIQARIPAALVGGRISADVGSISGDSAAADNLEAAADGTGYNLGGGSVVAASVTGAVGSVTGNVGGNVGGNVTGSVGSLGAQAKLDVNAEADTAIADAALATAANLATAQTTISKIDDTLEDNAGTYRFTSAALAQAPTGGTPPTAADIADAVLDEAIAGHTTAGTLGKAVADILIDTAEIGAAGAGLTALPWNAAWDAEVESEVADGLAAYDPPTKAELDAAVAPLATTAGIPSAGTIADAVHDEAVDGSTTLRESVRLWNSALGGKASGLGTTTAVFRDLADSKDRITATVDASGNRTAVTRDLT
jgi:hypothetical protein